VENAQFDPLEDLDLEGGKKTKQKVLTAAVEGLEGVPGDVNVEVNDAGTNVKLSKGEANETVNVDVEFYTDIHLTEATYKDYEVDGNVVGQSVVLGINKDETIDELPANTTISLFSAGGVDNENGLRINRAQNSIDITRPDTQTAWGTTTTFMYDEKSRDSDSWTSDNVGSFTDETELGYISVQYEVNGVTFSKAVPLTEPDANDA